MNTDSKTGSARNFGNTLSDTLNIQFGLFTELLKNLSQIMPINSQSCCDIPPPCWMPVALGEIVSHACPGASTVTRLLITNCDRVSRTMTISAAGEAAGLISLSPTTLTLGPKERGQVSAILKVPPKATGCQEFETLLWIRGCKEQYLRWTVAVGMHGGDNCHEVEVEDCPDLIHHWYDHFYCARPCFHDRTKELKQ